MTTQMIIWLATPISLGGNNVVETIAADVLETEGEKATIQLSEGVLVVNYSHSYTASNGDVSSAIEWVDSDFFIDLRQAP